jgi:hypothetical protein
LPMVTSWISLWRACPLVSYPYMGYESLPSSPSSMVLTSGLQISVMHIWKLLLWNEIISLQVLNLVSWKTLSDYHQGTLWSTHIWTTLAWTLHRLSPQWRLLTLQGRTWYLDETQWWFVWVCDHVCQWPLPQNVGPKIIDGYSSEEV